MAGSGSLLRDSSEVEQVGEALTLGLRDYVEKTGLGGVVLGLSGGIDSALVVELACRALGPERVRVLAMPSRYSSLRSVVDAEEQARRSGVVLDVVSIEGAHEALSQALDGVVPVVGVTDENIQARLRGDLVMALANATGFMALATGNKSELAVGYCTLYGDMCGGLAPIGDLYKTEVYELSEALSPADEGRIPASV